MMDPYFYRNHLARRYYLDHVNLKHKDFAAWDHKIQLIYGLVALTTARFSLVVLRGVGRSLSKRLYVHFRDLLCLISCRNSRLCLR